MELWPVGNARSMWQCRVEGMQQHRAVFRQCRARGTHPWRAKGMQWLRALARGSSWMHTPTPKLPECNSTRPTLPAAWPRPTCLPEHSPLNPAWGKFDASALEHGAFVGEDHVAGYLSLAMLVLPVGVTAASLPKGQYRGELPTTPLFSVSTPAQKTLFPPLLLSLLIAAAVCHQRAT